ncbi:MAG: hypothetical protein QW589_05165 [Candidatus Bathyarchaeia archaeon]
MDALQQSTIEELCKNGAKMSMKNEKLAQSLKLKEAEALEIISLMDNSIDYLSTTQRKSVKNFKEWTNKSFCLLTAEHGFSMLIRVFYNNKFHAILFDAGNSPNGVLKNAKRWK